METIAERMGITKNQRRRLGNHVCAWCSQSLDREACGAIHDPCTEEQRSARRQRLIKAWERNKG